MAYVPTLEEITGPVIRRIRDRIREIRERIRERIPFRGQMGSQIKIGGGELMSIAQEKISTISAKVQELRPGILPKVAEYKPGTLVTTILGGEGKGTTTFAPSGSPPVIEEKEVKPKGARVIV